LLEQRPGQLGAENEETRPAFVDTLEAMEDGLKDAIHEAHDAVTAATDAANDTLEATGKAAREGARGAADAFARALDVPGHVSRHPWVALGAVILAGLLLVRFCRRQ
jgi:ElaB/YqjD/DUF883 family membrane-anchored ribosome-binding protein